jgi:hypothetical protein
MKKIGGKMRKMKIKKGKHTMRNNGREPQTGWLSVKKGDKFSHGSWERIPFFREGLTCLFTDDRGLQLPYGYVFIALEDMTLPLYGDEEVRCILTTKNFEIWEVLRHD